MDATRRDVAAALRGWLDAGRAAVLATVVSTSDSAPRGLGAQLAVVASDEWVGALSGGCTEGAVIAEAERLLAQGSARDGALVAYAKETLGDVGPVCGATLGVVVERVDEQLLAALERAVQIASGGTSAELALSWRWGSEPPAAGGPEPGRAWPLERVSAEARAAAEPARARVQIEIGPEMLEVHQQMPPAAHLVLGGAGDVARELVLLAERLAWRTTIVDPRRTLLEQTARSCRPTRTFGAWAVDVWDEVGVDSRTACVALAHESHVDEPFLGLALQSAAAYVGAVGSRRVQAARREALAEQLDAAAVERLRGPAGLDLGGSAAPEIALSIAGEIVAVFNDRSGMPLAETKGPIRA